MEYLAKLSLEPRIVDAVTVGIGLAAVLVNVIIRAKTRLEPMVSLSRCGADFLNGCVVIPFSLLVFTPATPAITKYLHDAAPVTMPIAGVIGLFFIIAELLRSAGVQMSNADGP